VFFVLILHRSAGCFSSGLITSYDHGDYRTEVRYIALGNMLAIKVWVGERGYYISRWFCFVGTGVMGFMVAWLN
jgi:uncharacterized protein (DUF779 family)